MKRVLLVKMLDLGNSGGVNKFCRDWIEAASNASEECQFTLFSRGKCADESSRDWMEQRGVKVICADINKRIRILRPILFARAIRSELNRGTAYDIVHVNSGAIFAQYIVIREAVKRGIPVRVAHSHNNINYDRGFRGKVHNYFRHYLKKHATRCVACSKEAGEWIFGSNIENASNFCIVKNRIAVKRFAYDERVRMEVRKELGLSQEILLGNVGLRLESKNQLFLIDIVKELINCGTPVKLVIVGGGDEKKQELQNKIKENHLEDFVCLYGHSDHVERLLMAMDIYLQPSLFEGFCIAALEAQAAGLPCIVSDRLPDNVAVTPNVEYLPIEDAKVWTENILKKCKDGINRYPEAMEMILEAGFGKETLYKDVNDLYNLVQ